MSTCCINIHENMSIILREYQKTAINMLKSGFSKHKRQVLCAPTGSGKTVIFAQMVYLSASNGTSTLVLTHRIELFEQTFKAIDRLGVPIQRVEAKTKNLDSGAMVTVAMVETIERRIKKGFAIEPKLIIIDEAHFGNFTKIIKYFENSFIIGVTATPIGKHFHSIYTQIVETITLSDLIKQKYLCDYKGYQMQDDFSEVKKSKGEFEEASLFEHYDKPELYAGVVEKYVEKANSKKTLVFCCNIEHSYNTTQAFTEKGIKAKCITSRTEKSERKQILADYDNGEFPVLVNCGILTTGFDCPTIEVIIVNRATLSLPLWLQMCGRGSRRTPTKEMFTVLDFGKNHDRHGMWSEDRIWSLKKPKAKKEKAPPVKDCPACGAMVAASARTCKWCGYEFIAPDKDSEMKDGVLVEVTRKSYIGKKISQCTLEELIQIQKAKIYTPAFIWRIVRSRDELARYARLMGYSYGWVYHQKKEHDNIYKDYTVIQK